MSEDRRDINTKDVSECVPHIWLRYNEKSSSDRVQNCGTHPEWPSARRNPLAPWPPLAPTSPAGDRWARTSAERTGDAPMVSADGPRSVPVSAGGRRRVSPRPPPSAPAPNEAPTSRLPAQVLYDADADSRHT